MDTVLKIFNALNGGLVLLFGFALTLSIGEMSPTRKNNIAAGILLLLQMAAQGTLFFLLGEQTVRKLYPLLIHLPLFLFLLFFLRKKPGICLICICLGYLCCQFPRWIQLMVTAISGSDLAGAICYTVVIAPIFFLLHRYFVRPAREVMVYSSATLYIFGSLPLAYYLFDYVTVVYADHLTKISLLLGQFLPTATIFFYAFFLASYHHRMLSQTKAELQQSLLESELKQSETEIENLRQADAQSAIYRHDFRHHMSMIHSFLLAGDAKSAEEYVCQVQSDMDQLAVRRFCENETLNLLCSSFTDKAAALGIRLNITATLPKTVSIPDTELCSIISNGLENALHGVNAEGIAEKQVDFYCQVKRNKLLIEIKNPYAGDIRMEDGLPVSHNPNHGYGCRSIRGITENHRGLCVFEAADGIFTLRVVLPLTP